MELKKREEMSPEFMWDLTPIFPNTEEWEKALAVASARVKEIPKLAGTLGKSKESFKNALDFIVETGRQCELCYVYSFLKKSGDNGDPKNQEMQAKGQSLFIAYSTASAFLDPEILSIGKDTLTKWMESEELTIYRFLLEDKNRARDHILDEPRERMLAMLGDAAQTPSDTFEMLESVDMSFPAIKDENDEDVTLTHGNYSVYRESNVQSVRKEAFEKYFSEFKKYINTFAATYSAAVKFDSFFADVKGFESACHSALFASNVPVSVYDSLVDAIHSGLPTMRRYIELRKKVLGLDVLNMYDLYNPMVASVEWKVPFADGKELVKSALKPLGEEYGKLLEKAFSESWIDVYENKGKTTGAYSCGVYGVHPFVLLNYTDTLDDAFTLAHELGHSMHSYFSAREQEYVNSDYRILVAEVASTVNEVFMTKYLLATEKDPARRAYVLNLFLEGFRTTVFRQTLFAEFERKAHDMYKNGVPLTADSLNKLYRELNELYYDGANVNELQDIEWARIPHFYRGFYVYQYATGFCSAVAIVKNILESGSAENYLKFLSTGGSDYPINELKIAGVDLTDPATVKNALTVFSDTLDELRDILVK